MVLNLQRGSWHQRRGRCWLPTTKAWTRLKNYRMKFNVRKQMSFCFTTYQWLHNQYTLCLKYTPTLLYLKRFWCGMLLQVQILRTPFFYPVYFEHNLLAWSFSTVPCDVKSCKIINLAPQMDEANTGPDWDTNSTTDTLQKKEGIFWEFFFQRGGWSTSFQNLCFRKMAPKTP